MNQQTNPNRESDKNNKTPPKRDASDTVSDSSSSGFFTDSISTMSSKESNDSTTTNYLRSISFHPSLPVLQTANQADETSKKSDEETLKRVENFQSDDSSVDIEDSKSIQDLRIKIASHRKCQCLLHKLEKSEHE